MNTYGHGNCARIPSLTGYEQAKAHYEGVTPIRGQANMGIRPLGKERRFTWYQIDKRGYANQYENTEYTSYVCHLYRTDCVEFYPNGDITLRTGGWQSPTTSAFIGYTMRDLGQIISESGKWYFVNTAGQSFLFSGELQLKRETTGHMVAKQQVQEYKHTVDRKVMNKYRKIYKPFIDYGRTMLSISNTITMAEVETLVDSKLGFTDKNVLPYYNWQNSRATANRNRFFNLLDEQLVSGDLDLLYDLASYVARGAGRYVYSTQAYICEPKEFLDKFTEMLKYEYRDEIFKAEPIEIGKRFIDGNKKYFN